MGYSGDCLYFRETGGSRVAGFIFATIFCIGGIATTVWSLTQPPPDGLIFAALSGFVSAVFTFITVISIKDGPYLIVYDRASREIRFRKTVISADQVHYLSSQEFGTRSTFNRYVVAVMRDGNKITIGPTGASTWPMHWAHDAAHWMGLEYQHSIN